MKAVFVTLGCKVNQYETRILEERFAQAGIVPAEKGEKAVSIGSSFHSSSRYAFHDLFTEYKEQYNERH